MSILKTSDLTGDLRNPPAQRALPEIALALLAALLPLLLMLLAAFAGPRFFAAWTVQIPFTAGFGAAGIIGVAIICAALLVGYVQVAISQGSVDTELGRRQADAVAIGLESRERLTKMRAYLATLPPEGARAR
jgi:predicted RND superfamily exporter protein